MFGMRTVERLTNAATQPKFSGDAENAVVSPDGRRRSAIARRAGGRRPGLEDARDNRDAAGHHQGWPQGECQIKEQLEKRDTEEKGCAK